LRSLVKPLLRQVPFGMMNILRRKTLSTLNGSFDSDLIPDNSIRGYRRMILKVLPVALRSSR
jgi:hypothetical protein